MHERTIQCSTTGSNSTIGWGQTLPIPGKSHPEFLRTYNSTRPKNVNGLQPPIRGVYPPKTSGANPPHSHRPSLFYGVRFQSMGNCKRRRREAAIAEVKKPLATTGSEGAS